VTGPLAWGARVSAAFRSRVQQVGAIVATDPSWLMAVMEQESSLDPTARNPSGAAGLIQFMPGTAAALGTTTEAILAMPAVAQLDLVQKYFMPWRGRLRSLGDLYGAVIWPGMIGQPTDYVVFDKADPTHPARYLENKGLDLDGDGKVTRAEICARVLQKLRLGLQPGNVWNG